MSVTEYNCKTRSIRMLTPTVFELAFETDKPLNFKAGQFISIVIPADDPKRRGMRRAYSIASFPGKTPLELCIKLTPRGPGTRYLYSLKPGDSFRAYAPYGDFLYIPKPDYHACFIATGTGISPFRSIFHSEEFKNNLPLSSTCLAGFHDEHEPIYINDIEQLSLIKLIPCVSKPEGMWDGFKGRVTDYLKTLQNNFPWLKTEYYMCGNGAMIEEVRNILTLKGVDKSSIHHEIYYK